MKRIATLLALAAATFTVGGLAPTAHAQPAAALGRPLPDDKLPVGTVLVRVVAGSPANPVIGTDVTLIVNNTPRNARTDSAGRATFGGLPAGANVQATVLDANSKEIQSEGFTIPAEGGVRLMLSTKPFVGMGGAPTAPFAGGATGMPDPRAMSGQPRPDQDDPAGTFTVRLTYADLKLVDRTLTDPNPPVGTIVAMVGYAADDTVTVQTAAIDATGLVHFRGLDQTGSTSYFALAQLPRNGGTDRLIAVPAVLDSQNGARVVLSGEKRDSTAPPIDDYTKLVPSDGSPTPAGKVRITLDGVPTEPEALVSLIDAATGKTWGITKPGRGAADTTNVRGGANFETKPDLAANTLDVTLKGGAGAAQNPIAGVEVNIIDATSETPIAGATGKTAADGTVRITVAGATGQVKAVLIVNGKPLVSAPLDVSKTGGKLDVMANWDAQGRPEATFDVAAAKPGTVFYAQTRMSGQLFRSLPFQIAPEVGFRASVYIYPRTLFRFSLRSFVEDNLLAVQGSWEITNFAWAPYRDSADGMMLRLPEGHKGGIVAPQDANDVSVVAGEGFRIIRPIPPGGRKFRAGFSLPISGGDVKWSWALPLGTWQSGMEIRQTPGVSVSLPPGVKGETRTATTGEPWFVVDDITIERKKSMVLTISGLPAEAAWKIWVPRLVGVLVLLTIMAGVGFAIVRRSTTDTDSVEARRAQLLDELVELEKSGRDAKRKELVLAELERLWTA